MRTVVLVAVGAVAVGAGAYFISQSSDGDDGDGSAQRERETRRGAGRGVKSDAPPRRSSGDDDVGLETRIAKLEQEMAVLRRQLALGRPSVGNADADLVEQLDDPRLDSTVRDIVADERQRQQTERWQRRSERALEQMTETIDLTDDQQTAIAALWDTEREQISPLFVAARSGDRDFDEVLQEVEAVREATDAEAAKLLSETQLEGYLENRPRGPGGRGRGGDGRRGRGEDRGGESRDGRRGAQ